MSFREEIGVPPGSVEIEVDRVRIAVAREGAGPAVVCLHAIGHGGRDFEAFAAAIRNQFDVVRIDWPSQGRSGPDHQPLSPARYAELVAGVLDRLKVESPIIVGNSIGGAAALIYAAQHPVRGLVLCDSGGLVAVGRLARTFCGVFSRFFAAGERRARWFPAAFRAYYRFVVLPSPAAAEQRERIIRAAYEIAPVLREAWAGFGKQSADIRHLAIALNTRVWFAWAKNDKVIPLRMCLPCIQQMKDAKVTEFDAGHSAFLEQPAQFAEEFLKFATTVAIPEGTRQPLRSASN